MLTIRAGSTSQTIYLEVLDSASTTGGRKTGIAWNASGLTAYYARTRGAATQITLASLASASAAWTSGGWIEVDATNMPGIYRLDLPDAAVATGAQSVVITVKGASGMVQVSKEIRLVAYDPDDATRLGLSALPNAAAGANGGLPTVDAANAVKVQSGTGANQIDLSSGAVKLQPDQAVNVTKVAGTTQTARDLGAQLDVAVSTRLAPTVAGRTLNVSAGGRAAVNLDDTEGALSKGTEITGFNDPSAADNASAVWSAGTRSLTDKAGFRLATEVRSGTAQGGAAGSITLDSGASSTDGYYTSQLVVITAGTGAGQVRLITGYTGSTRVASVTPNWTTAPDNTSQFTLLPVARLDLGMWAGSVPNALLAGRVDANTQAMGADVLDASALAASAASEIANAVGTRQATEGYRANGAAPTLDQFMSEVLAHLGEASVSGTTKTIKKFDHATTAETFGLTLDMSGKVTDITRTA